MRMAAVSPWRITAVALVAMAAVAFLMIIA